jgi:hypothetical protein
MADVPGTSLSDAAPMAPRSHAARGVWARAARRNLAGLRDPRRLIAIAMVGVCGGLIAAWLIARGDLVGADARAYWAAVRVWLGGGDPYNPGGIFLPYAYAPWLLPLFIPWALLPWDVAWTVWQGSMIILFAWSFTWAYGRHPLATAALVAVLTIPLTATLDTGNVTLFLALAIWAAQFAGPVVAGALWSLATGMKWFPAILIGVLRPRARFWGLVFLAVAGVLTLVMWRQTLVQLDIVLNFPRPLRVDYLLILWAIVPWVWRLPRPVWWLHRGPLAAAARRTSTAAGSWVGRFRRDPGAALRSAAGATAAALRSFLGIETGDAAGVSDAGSPGPRGAPGSGTGSPG